MRWLLIALLLPACATKPDRRTESRAATLGDRARLVLESHCGECHIGAYDRPIARALAVFDLSSADWSASLTREQAEHLIGRLREPQVGTRAGDPIPLKVGPADLATVEEFVSARHGSTPVTIVEDFLATACKADTARFADEWLAHEERNWAIYEPLFYRDPDAAKERLTLAKELGTRQVEMCAHARAFLAKAPAALARARTKVLHFYRVLPPAKIYYTAALQWTDGRADDLDGHPAIVLNARHDSFARSERLAATLTHELIHDAQSARSHGSGDQLVPLVRGLYREGAAVYGVSQLEPDLAEREILLMSAAQVEQARSVIALAARRFLDALTTSDAQGMRRFFHGGIEDPPLPPRMGYVLGLEVFRVIAKERGVEAALSIAPGEFDTLARRVLADLGSR